MFATILLNGQHQGTKGSSSLSIPAGAIEAEFRIEDMRKTEYEDTLNSIELRAYVSTDQGQTWEAAGASRWIGGKVTGKDGSVNPPPTLTVSAVAAVAGNPDARVRCDVDVPREMRFSVACEVR